jgi:hypothetical protein
LTVTRIPFANVACRDERRTNEDAPFRQQAESFCAVRAGIQVLVVLENAGGW